MILSASYKTDIPAFYGEWFLRRLRAGYCLAVNPVGRQVFRVAMDRASVEGIVFWTKNLAPFFARLEDVRAMGYPFYIQYTITAAPRELETMVVSADRSVRLAREVVRRHGPRTVVWRYDPIVITSLTPLSFHRHTFPRLAAALEGTTDEVVISFAHYYAKTRRNLADAARLHGFSMEDPTTEQQRRELAEELAQCAAAHGMRLTCCSQGSYTSQCIGAARCVDAGRLSDVAGGRIRAPEKGNRPDCKCADCRDVGEYDTCPHGCVYCYAVQNRPVALARYRRHDPAGEFLFPPDNLNAAQRDAIERLTRQAPMQLDLLDQTGGCAAGNDGATGPRSAGRTRNE